MLFKKYHLLFLLLIIFSSCQDKNIVSFEYSLSTAQYGFSFDKMTVLSTDVNQNTNADFIVLPQMNDSGELLSPMLVQPLLKSSYLLSKQFDNLFAAEQYYNSMTTFSENGSIFNNVALSLKPFQIWIVKTNTNLYGKILISQASTGYVNSFPDVAINFKAELLK